MAISFTINFLFPKLDTGASNWGAGFNGALETIDIEIFQAQNPIVNRNGDIMVSILNGNVIQKRFSTTGG